MPKGNPYGYFDNDQPDMDGMSGKKDSEYMPGRDRSSYGKKSEKSMDRGEAPQAKSPSSGANEGFDGPELPSAKKN